MLEGRCSGAGENRTLIPWVQTKCSSVELRSHNDDPSEMSLNALSSRFQLPVPIPFGYSPMFRPEGLVEEMGFEPIYCV